MVVAAGLLAISCSRPLLTPLQPPTATPTAASWVLLPELPETAKQAEVGAQIDKLVCQACHGDHGQGLTPEWLAAWGPEERNCWQVNCHGPGHPSDSFQLPAKVPATVGVGALHGYATALDLFEHLRSTMPYPHPGSMLDEEYWQLTAFLLDQNHVDFPRTAPLDAAAAAQVLLHASELRATPTLAR